MDETTVSNLTFEMSPQIGELVQALAKAHKGFKAIIKTESNPFFKSKYADLAGVIEATKDGLSDNGLAVIQPPAFERSTGTVQVLTLLAHSSGQWIKAILDMPISKADAQGVGSAITYGRRYAYSAVLNVASESDDDGNAAVAQPFKKRGEESVAEFDQRTEDQQAIAIFQIQAIDEACKRTGKTEEEVAAYLGLIGHKRIEHVLKSQFNEFIKWANSVPKAKAISKGPSLMDQARTKAMNKLFAVASQYSIPESDLKTCAYEKFKVKSMTELSVMQVDELVKWVGEVAEQQTSA